MPRQIELFDIPTPCKHICQTDSKGYCVGCMRNREERFNWMSYNNEQKRNIIRLCHQRRLRQQYSLKYTAAKEQENDQLDLFDH